MNLREIASLLFVKKIRGDPSVEITGVQMDTRKIKRGDLFICIPSINGLLADRHNFAEEAVRNGAVALVVERDVDVDVPKLFVKDARYAMAVISAHFYNYPSRELKLIGLTGTNGKTTTSYVIEKILSSFGHQTGLIGNNGVKVGNELLPTDINTPEPPTLQMYLRKMRDVDTNYCVMEVSSQGLDMGRVVGCHFRTAVFTNLTQDHLDYHGNFTRYKEAKGLLFSRIGNGFSPEPNDKKYVILNADDSSSDYFRKLTTAEVITYGITNQADVTAKDIKLSSEGISFTLSSIVGEAEISSNLVGGFNVYNILAAIAATLVEGVPLAYIKECLTDIRTVSGRMEKVDVGQNFTVIIDYAHTPDGLESSLSTISEFAKERIITVFGCGGDRDLSKRKVMGQIACKNSDYVFVTSDNPRTEDPLTIMKNIEEGMIEHKDTKYELIVDREEAINKAIRLAQPNDIVLIAGKGNEKYQIINGIKYPFDDKEKAKEALISTLSSH
ncbi:UDP-N-acetylmuramoyl-L-alanyl-D-glutamate--2,6-diaminopimelate ligase [Niallia taxi]|uniref:UDP-N-acetylmuramoyl-L-alanyl-D-glutamate--2, 6-diaminopimelate ligase n=1 Tax=Niallia taxi TaxID=2499688 RepID=UPI0015F66E26|nr:UDP-N-acetylmuramoyl-L-alanyl-D-glutamate--2,6-diaminopimelate ligase [Niallia taxi]